MKATAVKKAVFILSLTGMFIINTGTAAWADTSAPTIARTRAWDTLEHTLGGVPETIKRLEYAGSVFYLGEGVTIADCLPILEGKPEVPLLKAAGDSGTLYGSTPVYILWNDDRTVLLVHRLYYEHQDILQTTIITVDPSEVISSYDNKADASINISSEVTWPEKIQTEPLNGMTKEQTAKYMLSDEYTDAVRNEFYRLLNEHRTAHGLRELEVNHELQEYADVRSTEIKVSFGHTRPDGSPAGSGWYDSQNYINTRYAENITCYGAFTADYKSAAYGIFKLWKESPGHNSHMLYDFDTNITMALGFAPSFDEYGFISSAGVFATGY